MRYKNIFILIILAVSFVASTSVANAADYYECLITGTSNSSSCTSYKGSAHICQLYEGYSGSGTPEFCSGYCLERSKIPENCATVSVQPSNNPEAHEKFINKFGGLAFFQKTLSSIRGMGSSVSKWWKDEIKCEGKKLPPQVGQITKVTGEGKGWIHRGLESYRAVRFAPILSGDTLTVDENLELEIELNGNEKMPIKQNTKMLISSSGITEQCLVERAKWSVAGTLGGMWNWMREKLQGEKFEIRNTTVVAGVRG